jgi:uncharacterized protein YkwD
MRKVWTASALAALLALAACDAGGSERSIDVSAVVSDKPILDANGHPLLLPNSDPGVTVFESELLRLVNDYRLALGLQPLIPVTNLGDAARAHARHMIEHRFISHVSPEGLIAGDRLSLLHVDWTAVSENIASAYSTPQAVFDAWLQSPPHRSVIESDRFTHAGAGYAMDKNPTPAFAGVHYWAMLFLQR